MPFLGTRGAASAKGFGFTALASGTYATLSPTVKGTAVTLSNGDLQFTNSSNPTSPSCRAVATLGMSSKKWYCEYTALSAFSVPGVMLSTDTVNEYVGGTALSWGYVGVSATKVTNNVQTAYGVTFTTNDIIGIAFDADAKSLTFYKNGASQGVAYSGLSAGTYYFTQGDYDNTITGKFNFGATPFAYTIPSGYLPLNTANL